MIINLVRSVTWLQKRVFYPSFKLPIIQNTIGNVLIHGTKTAGDLIHKT